jgi:CheY-like chemotaxis protein
MQIPIVAESLNSLSIILADDDPDDLDLFKDAVKEICPKMMVRVAGDVQQLTELLNDNHFTLPDIIFLDLNMPGKSGKEYLQEMRNDMRLKDIPVIIYSTSANTKDIRDAYSLGANLYIRKPTAYSQLLCILEKALSINWRRHTAPSPEENFVL